MMPRDSDRRPNDEDPELAASELRRPTPALGIRIAAQARFEAAGALATARVPPLVVRPVADASRRPPA